MRVRVKKCGKSGPPQQQCSGQGKPHTEQDQIGRKPESILTNQFWHVPARCVKPSGRSLEPRSDARPRGMAVAREQSRGQNSAYRSGCHKTFPFARENPALVVHIWSRWVRCMAQSVRKVRVSDAPHDTVHSL